MQLQILCHLILTHPDLSCRVALPVIQSERVDNAFTDSVDNINKSEKYHKEFVLKQSKL